MRFLVSLARPPERIGFFLTLAVFATGVIWLIVNLWVGKSFDDIVAIFVGFISLAGIIAFTTGLFTFLQPQDGFDSAYYRKLQEFDESASQRFRASLAREVSSGSPKEVQRELGLLRRELRNVSAMAQSADVERIVAAAADRVADEASSSLIAKIEADIQQRGSLFKAEEALRPLRDTIARISREIERLSRQNTLNLVTGLTIAIVGLGFLGFVLILVPPASDLSGFTLSFVPRLSLVALLQIFALFFLKLYKSGQDEIKFAHNEMTNVEQRLGALMVALVDEDPAMKMDILKLMAATDRNTRLEKGQSTIGLEQARIDAQGGAAEILKSLLPALVKR